MKYACEFVEYSTFCVASFAEAWIEIIALAIAGEPLKSPPSRRRGLKFFPEKAEVAAQQSPPSRRRGLKSECNFVNKVEQCRLLRGGVD